MPIETLVEIIEKYQRVSGSNKKSKKPIIEPSAKNSKPKNEIHSGLKNMQLLCVQSNEEHASKFINVSCQANDHLTETTIRKVSYKNSYQFINDFDDNNFHFSFIF